jgi:hypothetical protein
VIEAGERVQVYNMSRLRAHGIVLEVFPLFFQQRGMEAVYGAIELEMMSITSG